MRVKVLYFARLREMLGMAQEEISLPDEISDIHGLMAWQAARGGAWQAEFSGSRLLRAAVNQELVPDTATFKSGDEIAFFPPVTGG